MDRARAPPTSSPLNEAFPLVSHPSKDDDDISLFKRPYPRDQSPASTLGFRQASWASVPDSDTKLRHDRDSDEATAYSHAPTPGRLWRTGIWRNVPWRGLSSLVMVLASTLASAVLLAVSNGDAVSSWKVDPSVILAVLSAISTACLGFGLYSGLNITWWRKMIEGASLAEVHHHWDHGTNIWAALTAGRQISVMSVAKVFVALAAITEGPLVQQASKISSRQVSNTMPLQVALAPNLPPGYTADVTGEFRVPTTPSGPFSSVFNDYSNRVPIAAGFDGCPGSCTAEVPGVGFKVTCEPATNTTWDLKQYSMGIGKPQFTASTSWRVMSPDGDFYIAPNGSYEYLTVSAGWAINTVDPLVFTSRYCNLSLAVVSYPIRIVNNTVSLSLPLNQNPTVLHDLPMAKTAPGMGSTGQTTLGGFKLIGEGPFFANVSMVANGAAALYSLYGLNPFTWSHATNPDWDVMQYEGYTWRDPVPDVLSAYHEIMFRLGISAAANATLVSPVELDGESLKSRNTVQAMYTYSENYYVSNFRYLGGAMAVILLAVLSVMPTLRGWWLIGRPTTLSPLETAKAFGAPLLATGNSNDTVEDLARTAKHRKVKYGATDGDKSGGDGGRLRIDEYQEVVTPRNETVFRS